MTKEEITQKVAALVGQLIISHQQPFYMMDPSIESVEHFIEVLNKIFHVQLDDDMLWTYTNIEKLVDYIASIRVHLQ